MCADSAVPHDPDLAQNPDPRPDASSVPDAAPVKAKHGHQGEGKREERLVRHFKIDERLSTDDRAAYEALMLDPRQTVDSLQAWLRSRGYEISRGAVQRHRRHFEKDVKEIRKT